MQWSARSARSSPPSGICGIDADQNARRAKAVTPALRRAVGPALGAKREADVTGLWVGLAQTNAAKLVEVSPVTADALTFWMVHGCKEPRAASSDNESFVVLRNDDYTTVEFAKIVQYRLHQL